MNRDPQIDADYVRRERKRLADPRCDQCGGDGVLTITVRRVGEREIACQCVERKWLS